MHLKIVMKVECSKKSAHLTEICAVMFALHKHCNAMANLKNNALTDFEEILDRNRSINI